LPAAAAAAAISACVPGGVQMGEGRVDVGEDGVVVRHVLEKFHHLLEVPVFDDRARTRPMEEVGRDRVVARGRGTPGDVFDVGIDAEGFLNDDDRTPVVARRPRLVQPHRTVGRLDRDVVAGDIGVAHLREPRRSPWAHTITARRDEAARVGRGSGTIFGRCGRIRHLPDVRTGLLGRSSSL